MHWSLSGLPMTIEAIFARALAKSTPAERTAYLDEACAHDLTLRQRVETLLQSHEAAGDFLGKPAIQRAAEELAGSARAKDTQGETPVSVGESEPLAFLVPSDKPGILGRLSHYQVLEVIGRGGMGIVLRAFDDKLHRVVAIKVMAAQLATNATARRRFAREAQAAAAVIHDHIVTIHAVEEAEPLPYLVMHYVAGLSLQQRLDREGPLELHEILRIGMQTASGLAAAHAQGLIHRDIKPANILLENGVERVKITDFGLARAVADASQTQSGVVTGTPQYMSPEQARGEAVDQRTDLFSLGSVLYAMCTGLAPFRGSNSMSVLKRVCDEAPTPIREANPEIPDWLVAIIGKLHAKDPAERYQSAAGVAESLRDHLAHLQHPSVVGPDRRNLTVPLGREAGGGDAVCEPAPRCRHWAIAAAAILLCLVGGLGFSEAAGITSLRAAIIRIFTPDGTLIVEVDDPGVKVTIEGDGGIVIAGAGLEEIRLRPGKYKVLANKEGKRVPLERELVSIAKGGREVVKVKLEVPAGEAAATTETGAFVLLAAGTERKFDDLTNAVLGASDGDTIEVRGNGPYISGPVIIGNGRLTVRAANGYRPIIQFTHNSGGQRQSLCANSTSLTLEGLEFRSTSFTKDSPLAFDVGISFHAANCRFLLPDYYGFWSGRSARRCVLKNSEFLSRGGHMLGGDLWSDTQWVIDNCVQVGGKALFVNSLHQNPKNASIQLTGSTLVGGYGINLAPPATARRQAGQGSVPVPLRVTDTILDSGVILAVHVDRGAINEGKPITLDDVGAVMRCLVDWQGQHNIYGMVPESGDERSRFLEANGEPGATLEQGPLDLTAWRKLWGSADAGSMQGRIRYLGGNLGAKLTKAADQLTPEDFRLRSDSAGYRARKDGKDLGADIDFVGPGKAYERWQKTPAYQQWLKDSGQLQK